MYDTDGTDSSNVPSPYAQSGELSEDEGFIELVLNPNKRINNGEETNYTQQRNLQEIRKKNTVDLLYMQK